MKVLINTKDAHGNTIEHTYMVRFYYPHARRFLKNQTTVLCHISERVGNKVVVLVTGRAYCVSGDVFDKKIGRKTAFENAVRDFSIVYYNNDRNVRKSFWDVFLKVVKLPNHKNLLIDKG